MNKPLIIKANCSLNGNLHVGTGNSIEIPIGALVALEVEIYIKGEKATVLNSNWILEGKHIDDQSVRQDKDIGCGKTIVSRNCNGGYSNNNACITNAWIGRLGIYKVSVTGNASYKEETIEFKVNSNVHISGPVIKDIEGNVSQPTFDEGKLLTQFSGYFTYNVDDISSGGIIGFLQLIKGLRFRRGINGQKNQLQGQTEWFIDFNNLPTDPPNPLLYTSKFLDDYEVRMNDSPSLLCEEEEEDKYDTYIVGYPYNEDNPLINKNPERYIAYSAYKAPINDFIIKSYIVVNKHITWEWREMGVYNKNEGGWGPESDFTTDDCVTCDDDIWKLPIWRSNSEDLKKWRDE